MDVHSKETRSYNMSRIKCKNTTPELYVRKWLWSHGLRYRLKWRNLPGKPDIIFPRSNVVVFIHGCFWHKHDCEYFKWPATNSDFWNDKILGNVERDKKNIEKLEELGWYVIVLWECIIRKEKEEYLERMFSNLYEKKGKKGMYPVTPLS